ncbi:MAG TPA: uroporphyrinogen-III C-methyltransferase [Prolixibacteraceae bacterium]|nr:uroporphyrinogen-III C-methyltransferase [Prolixibacteraceae bacterium]
MCSFFSPPGEGFGEVILSHLISIVGAGPGDPELLTIKALKRIQEADCILHDALVSEEILKLAKPEAQRLYVGKLYQDGQDQTERQEGINQLIIDLAAKGQKVVRLKSGDPMIFGRGAEEIRFCIENKLDYEVIPGVTSALAAASLYGIPLTERGKNSMVLFATGHYQEGEFIDIETFVSVLKSGSPVVFFMGLNKLVRLAEQLLNQSISAETKVQILSKVSQPGAVAFESTLGTIAHLLETEKPPMPAMVIIGKNVERLSGKMIFS